MSDDELSEKEYESNEEDEQVENEASDNESIDDVSDSDSVLNPDEDVNTSVKTAKKTKKAGESTSYDISDDSDEDENDNLHKIDRMSVKSFHPEVIQHDYNDVLFRCGITRNKDGVIVDEKHKTFPILTKYERTKVIGLRATQINNGSDTFVVVPENIIDGYIIAEMELEKNKIPFIIKRPLSNGDCEYWKLSDLINIY